MSRNNSKIFVSLMLVVVASAAADWERIGPEGGDQFGIAVSPGDPTMLYSTAHFAVHRSQNRAGFWEPLHNETMAQGSQYALVFDPDDAQTLYVAGSRSGVWRSSDGGDSWVDCGAGLPREGDTDKHFPVASLAIDAAGSVFAGMAESERIGRPPALVYRSETGCGDWVVDDTGITVTLTEPSEPITVLLNGDAAGSVWASVYGAGLFRYSGGSWVDRFGDLPQEALRATYLHPAPGDAERLLLGTERDWVYETLDGGATWSRLPLPDMLEGLATLPLAYTLAIDPNNPDVIAVSANDSSGSLEQPLFRPGADQTSGGGIYVSIDGGASWICWSVGGAFRIAVDPSETTMEQFPVTRSRYWYFSSGGRAGIVKSSDGLISVAREINGLHNLLVNRIWLAEGTSLGGSTLLAASEAGLFSLTGGSSWGFFEGAPETLYNWSFAADTLDEDQLLFATGNPSWGFNSARGVYRMPVSCFSATCDDPEQLLSGVGVWQLITTPLRPGTIYAASQEEGVLVSEDNGVTWQHRNAGLDLPASVTDLLLDSTGELGFAAIRASSGAVDLDLEQHWWPSSDESGALYRFDAELTQWVKVDGIDAAVLDLERDPFAEDTIYAATVTGLWRSTNDGYDWELLLDGPLINDLLLHPNRQGYLYAAATPSGLLRSTNGGEQWHELSDGLLNRTLYSLAFDSSSGNLYAGTGGNSVYVLLADTRPVPELALDLPELDLGTVPAGVLSWGTVTVINAGEADLTIDAIETDDSRFEVDPGGLPLVLTPGSWTQVRVGVTPDQAGLLSGNLSFHSNADTVVLRVVAEGRDAVPPAPDVQINGFDSPVELEYGSLMAIGVGLVDTGDFEGQELEYWLEFLAGDGNRYWYVDDTGWVASDDPRLLTTAPAIATERFELELPVVVEGEGYVTFHVDGDLDGRLGEAWSDSVTFTVLPPPAKLVVSAESLELGEVSIGFGKESVLWIGNGGGVDMEVKELTITGAGFDLVSPPVLPLLIAPDGYALLTVRFQPEAIGPHVGSLTVTTESAGSQSVALSGEGRDAVAPTLVLTSNGETGRVVVSVETQIEIALSLDPADYRGTEAEWWLIANTPFGDYWYVYRSGWQRESPMRLYEGAMVSVGDFVVLQSTLPAGNYVFTFSLDEMLDGEPSGGWTDQVTVVIE